MQLPKFKKRKKRKSSRQSQTVGAKKITRSLNARTWGIYSLVFLSFGSIILRLAYLQIDQGAQFRATETRTIADKIPVLPPRGRIFDTNGTLLAYDQPIYQVDLIQAASSQKDWPSIAGLLAPVFNTTPAAILKTLNQQKLYAVITLFKNINEQQLAFITENHDALPGVAVELSSERRYPYGVLAGHALGYVGSISSSQQNYYVGQLKYLLNQQVGETGLELQYNNLLEGTPGDQRLMLDSTGTKLESTVLDPPVAGDNLKLTLDGSLQAATQEEITSFINSSPYKSTINDAAAVMLDVKTGGVLSLVSYPYYDPNWYTVPGTVTKYNNYLANSGAQENNAIQNPNYPGSTVKPANMITALNQKVITPSTAYYVPYQILIGTAIKHDDMPHGFVDDAKAITVSSDVFFYNIGLWLSKWMGSSPSSGGGPAGGISLQQWRDTDFAKGLTELFNGEWRFGLGQRTGIDLPGEQQGRFYVMDANQNYAAVPFPLLQATQSIQKTGKYVNYSTPVSIALASIGQEQQFTPIQMAQYVATIADGGVRIQPHLLQAVYPPGLVDSISSSDKPIQTVTPKIQAKLNINPTYLQVVQQGMYGVCNNPAGTAYPDFQGAPYKAAGKTGTADIYLNGVHMTNSVFIAYAPFNNPQVAVAVMIPGGGYGAESAAAVARAMMDTYFKEHHEFFPKSQWTSTTVPASWLKSSANTVFTAK